MTTTTPTTLSTALTTSGFPLHPSTHFLTTILTSSSSSSSGSSSNNSNHHQSRPTTQPPLPALVATAKHRLLFSDFTTSPCILAAAMTGYLPANISDPSVRERRLGPRAAGRGNDGNSNGNGRGEGGGGGGGQIPVQVLAVEDLSRSRWEQLEAIEAVERGEMTKGREIIRVVETEEGTATATAMAGARAGVGPHRLVLQDVKGRTVYGLELKPVKGVGMGMSIGAKMLLSGVTVARGVLLLEPETAAVLGGKIDSLHKAWVENRKTDLLAAVEGAA